MEKALVLLQRLYWVVLAAAVVVLGLANSDLLRSEVEVDLLLGRFTVRAIWFLAVVLIAFLLQVFISRLLLAVTRGRVEKLGQELAQVKASLFDRGRERAERESPEPGAPPEARGESQ